MLIPSTLLQRGASAGWTHYDPQFFMDGTETGFTQHGDYINIDKMCVVRIQLLCGGGLSLPAAQTFRFSLPFNFDPNDIVGQYSPLGFALASQLSTTQDVYLGVVRHKPGGTPDNKIDIGGVAAPVGALWGTTVPFTWAASDRLDLQLIFQAEA